MARHTLRTLLAALVAALALGSTARADDTDLFLKGNLPPNVLVILDTSQSMTWYNKDGNTLGDEFAGFAGKPTSRIAGAKKVLSDTIIAFSGEINFGLATYNQGNAATNVVV